MNKYLLIGYCLLMVFCSSLPKTIEPRSETFAQMKMNSGNDAQKRQQYTKALKYFREAYDLYTRVDNIDGKINSGLSIARQYFYLDKIDKSQQWLALSGNLIDLYRPQMNGAKILFLIEMAFAKNDFQKVLQFSPHSTANNPEWLMEYLCYTMVAKMHLNLDYHTEFMQLIEKLEKMEKAFRKRRMNDPEVLSISYYYLGYIYSFEKKWQAALENFEKAKEIDGLLDNSYGVAKALFSQGQCFEKLENFERAAGCFGRAAEIFAIMGDEANAQKALMRTNSARKKQKK